MPKIEKTTLKRYTGGNPCCGQTGEWVSIFLETDSDITRIGDDILVSNPIGLYKAGDVIPSTENVFHVLQNALTQYTVPEYVAPTVSVKVVEGPEPGSYPPGTTLNAKLRAEATQNDAGELILLRLIVNGEEIARSDSALVLEADVTWNLSETIEITAAYQYADGPIKNDSFGNPYEEGRILAGEIFATAEEGGAEYRVQTYSYSGYDLVDIEKLNNVPTQDEILALQNVTLDISADDREEFQMEAGYNRFIIAVPTAAKVKVSSIIYREAGFQEILNIFKQETITMRVSNDVDASYTGEYDVYWYTWPQPMVADLTMQIQYEAKE